MNPGDRYKNILSEIKGLKLNPSRLVVVSKKRTIEEIMHVYHAGCRDFGENRVEDALFKMSRCPNDIRWHMIGTLQTKKVSKAVGQFSLIHSVDTQRLAEKISETSLKKNLKTPILLQVNTSGETTKHGLSITEWEKSINRVLSLKGIEIKGVMTMAPLTEDQRVIRRCFSSLKTFRDTVEKKYQVSLPQVSMGMSHDYLIAIEEGATLLRIGSAIFENAL